MGKGVWLGIFMRTRESTQGEIFPAEAFMVGGLVFMCFPDVWQKEKGKDV